MLVISKDHSLKHKFIYHLLFFKIIISVTKVYGFETFFSAYESSPIGKDHSINRPSSLERILYIRQTRIVIYMLQYNTSVV